MTEQHEEPTEDSQEESEKAQDEEADGEDLDRIEPVDLSRFYESAFNPLKDHFKQQNSQLAGIISNAARVRAQWAVPRIAIPVPLGVGAAVETLRKQMADLTGFNDAIRQALEPYTAFQAERWQRLFSSMAEAVRSIYPENLRELAPGLDEMETLLVDEGIPLMWVPAPRTVQALLEAPDAATRRRLIGRRWKGITNDCEAVLEGVEHPALQDARGFALDVVDALRGGHTNAAQALAANLLDSLLRGHVTETLRVQLTRNDFKAKGIKFKLDDYKFKVACTFAPVWYAHAKYFPAKGDAIPRTFGRHPSAHGVSKLQYSRINAIYALMLVTSVIKFFDTEMPR
ncbi:hypothetical protein [Streptomyces sp. NPDC127114]|uniref:hypothetical protein n=1 Tax=Streptomyces sp. NPDC127114 TaxID=3345366 RepID=UPI00362FC9B4